MGRPALRGQPNGTTGAHFNFHGPMTTQQEKEKGRGPFFRRSARGEEMPLGARFGYCQSAAGQAGAPRMPPGMVVSGRIQCVAPNGVPIRAGTGRYRGGARPTASLRA